MRTFFLLAAVAMLSSCGGGGTDGESGAVTPSVTTITASPTRYGQTMTIAIVGRGLSGVSVSVDGRCDNLVRAAGGTDDAVQYTCTPRVVGEIVPRVRIAAGSRELGSVRAIVPLPQVRVTLTEGGGTSARAGAFVIELDPVNAPATVDNFLAYASGVTPFYVSTVVTHAEAERGILLGAYTLSSAGELQPKPLTRDPVVLEATAERKNLRGTVAMYRRGDAGSGNGEWLVNTQDNPFLDVGSVENPLGFAVFGRIVQGLEIAEEAAKVSVRPDLPTGFARVPVTPVRISAITQTR